jgi:drug/metabolite transporter (DMT)-like permease
MDNIKKENNKTIIAYILVCLLWGSTYLAIRIGVGEFPPFVFAGMRFLIAGAIMLVYSLLKGIQIPKKPVDILKISAVGLFLLWGGNGCVVFAETWVSSGMASLLVSTVPLFMVLIELALRLNTKISIKTWIGLLIGFGGVATLVLLNSNVESIDLKGALMLLFGSFMWACGSVYSKTFKAEGSVVAHIAIQMLAGGLGLSITGALLGEIPKIHITAVGIGALSYLIILGSIVGYSCYIYILKKWPIAKAGTYAYVNPVVAVFLGFMVLSEPISVSIVASALVILLGVVLVQSEKSK